MLDVRPVAFGLAGRRCSLAEPRAIGHESAQNDAMAVRSLPRAAPFPKDPLLKMNRCVSASKSATRGGLFDVVGVVEQVFDGLAKLDAAEDPAVQGGQDRHAQAVRFC